MYQILRVQTAKEKTDKATSIKVRNFCSLNHTTKRQKTTPHTGRRCAPWCGYRNRVPVYTSVTSISYTRKPPEDAHPSPESPQERYEDSREEGRPHLRSEMQTNRHNTGQCSQWPGGKEAGQPRGRLEAGFAVLRGLERRCGWPLGAGLVQPQAWYLSVRSEACKAKAMFKQFTSHPASSPTSGY